MSVAQKEQPAAVAAAAARHVPLHVNALAGGLGGIMQVVVGQPLDSVKSRMQAHRAVSWKFGDLFRQVRPIGKKKKNKKKKPPI